MSDESDLMVLHTLRVKGATAPEVLAKLTGLDRSQVDGALTTAVVHGFAVARDGRDRTFRLTPEGTAHAAQELHKHTDAAATAAAEQLYEAFLPLNAELKNLTTAWQIRDGEPNDHADSRYDAAVVKRLARVAAAIGRALPEADAPLGRMARYRERFDSAVARIDAGEHAAFARPMAESFHDAWMELHQDLLLTLGRERTESDGH